MGHYRLIFLSAGKLYTNALSLLGLYIRGVTSKLGMQELPSLFHDPFSIHSPSLLSRPFRPLSSFPILIFLPPFPSKRDPGKCHMGNFWNLKCRRASFRASLRIKMHALQNQQYNRQHIIGGIVSVNCTNSTIKQQLKFNRWQKHSIVGFALGRRERLNPVLLCNRWMVMVIFLIFVRNDN